MYTCKKCKKGFFTSPEATAHRKLCYPLKTATNNPEEDINEGGKGNGDTGGNGGGGEKGGDGENGGGGQKGGDGEKGDVKIAP